MITLVPLAALVLFPQPQAGPMALSVEKPRVLVFSKTAGYRHANIPTGVAALQALGKQQGWSVEATEDASRFTDEGLRAFDTVVFLSTSGDVLNDAQQDAFQRFIQAGGGFAGIHLATGTEPNWSWYGQLVGARFSGHPDLCPANMHVVDAAHPSTAHLPAVWRWTDEWYEFHAQPTANCRVLLTVDEKSYSGGKMGERHPIAWCQEFDGGRSWYTALGHQHEAFSDPLFLEHLREGILWAANAKPAPGAVRLGLEAFEHGGSWAETAGVMANIKGTRHLVTKDAFGDVHLHFEFKIPKGGNSGVYLMGRYEVQILDSFGVPNDQLQTHHAGAVYQRWKDDKGYEGSPPLRNAVRAPGEWNSYDILFKAPRFDASGKKISDATFVEVRLNGVVVQRGYSTTGPTRGPMFEDEKPTGPILIQGDHGPVEIRNVWIARRSL
ncbi:MAG TPA: ThuA domain-containing protein [Fimbriimonadaceae bacterium]|nr:ThuA domain-containing protein [Fimbriimonadaceae bacterium]